MSCTRPLIRTENGRIYPLKLEDMTQEKLKVLGRTGEYIDLDGQKGSIIRCGKCIGCQTDHAKEWSDRLVMESASWPENWFVTLTFDDDHILEQCGVYKTLKVEHLQKFMKRLRKEVAPTKIRFFACGEYGDKLQRPHYHLILFNLHLPVSDVTWLRQTKQGYDLYSSKLIEKCWPYGFNTLGSVTFESCGYVSRYTMKKVYGYQGKEFYEKTHRKPPFIVMSRNPGIGHDYIINHDWTTEPNVIVSDGEESHECPAPQYLERYLKKNDPFLAEERAKIKRRLAFETMQVKHMNTDLSRSDYAEQHEKILKNRTLVLTNRLDL